VATNWCAVKKLLTHWQQTQKHHTTREKHNVSIFRPINAAHTFLMHAHYSLMHFTFIHRQVPFLLSKVWLQHEQLGVEKEPCRQILSYLPLVSSVTCKGICHWVKTAKAIGLHTRDLVLHSKAVMNFSHLRNAESINVKTHTPLKWNTVQTSL